MRVVERKKAGAAGRCRKEDVDRKKAKWSGSLPKLPYSKDVVNLIAQRSGRGIKG